MSNDNDVPLGEGARRYYEQQFGERIRQVKKGGSAPSGGGPNWSGRAGCGAVVAVIFVVRVAALLLRCDSSSSIDRYSPSRDAVDIDVQQQLEEFRARHKANEDQMNEILRRIEENKPPFVFPGGEVVPEADADALLKASDVPLLEGLCYRIHQESRRSETTPGGHLLKLLDANSRTLLVLSITAPPLRPNDREDLLEGLNDVLRRLDFWEPAVFLKVPAVKAFLDAHPELGPGDRLSLPQRRRVLELCYPKQIVPLTAGDQLDDAARAKWVEQAQADLNLARREAAAKP
jgi:hypothetical protein